MIKKKICVFIIIAMMVAVMFTALTPKVDAGKGSATVKGFVRDQNNIGIPNAWIWYHNGGEGNTNTNETGYYFMSVSSGNIRVGAGADGFLQNETEIDIMDGETKWVNLTLSPRPPELCTLKGYVRDSETGDGIGKAGVNVWDGMGYNTWTETKSYPAGYFEVNTINGSLKVRANKEDYLGTEETVVMVDYQVTWQNFTLIYMPENSVVKGYVKDLRTGMPITDLRVNVHNRWNWGREDYTDETGYYEMDTIAGKMWLEACNEGYYRNETGLEIAEGETKWVNITMYEELSENATIYGYINDPEGTIGNANVRVYGYGEWEKETWTNSSGGYEMSVVATADLNVNLTLLVTADQHGSNTTTFSVDDGKTKQINLNLEKDSNPPEINFSIMPTGNISTNNPTIINGTIKEKYLRECGIYLAQYKEIQESQKAYVLRAFYRYTEEEEDGWGLEEELILTQTDEPDTYNFSVEWDATTEGGWVEYDGIKEYVIPSWYNIGQFNVEGKYYNNTNPTPRDGQARFNKITGKLDCINIHGDMGMEIYPEDDPTGMFAPSQGMLFFDASTGQLLGSENRMGAYFSVANVTFEYDLKVPTDEYAVLMSAEDYGKLANFSTIFIQIDNTNPKIESITITPEPPLNATTATFTITFNEAINQSVQLNVSFGLALPYTTHTITGAWQTSTTWQGSYLITNTTGDGVNTICVENAVDSAKNIMDPDTSNTFTIDTAKPALEIISPVNNTITNQSVTLNYSVSDNIDSPEDVVVNIENGTVFSDEGNFTITINATDRAGNIATESVSFIIDKTPPSITITNVTNNSYYNVSVTPIVETKDLNLDASTITLNGASFTSNTTIPEEGAYILRIETLDKAGNRATETIIFTIDKTKPIANAGNNKTIDQGTILTLSGSASTDINGSGIINHTWEFTDGILYTLYDEEVNHTFYNAGSFTVTLIVRDAAGNMDTDTVTITVKDIEKPTIDYTDPGLTKQAKGKPIKIELKVTDNVGIANVALYYRSMDETEWKSLPMTGGPSNLWSGTIPAEDVTDDIFYYFVATDTSGNNVTKPTDGKENPYKISVLLGGEEEGMGGWQSSILGIIAAAIIAAVCLLSFIYYKKKPKEKGKKVEEVKKIKPRKVKYDRGSCYIIREQTPETSFKVFSDFVKKGAPGLCVTRTNPEDVKEKYKLKNVELLWLTTGREDEHSINPTHIEKLTWVVKEFIKNNRDSIVLLDGVEYLIVQNNFLAVLKSLQALEDTVSMNESMLIIPISPMAISEKEMSYLERDFVVV